MAAAERDGSRILIDTDYRDSEMVRQVPGVKWMHDRTWRAPLTWPVCLALRGIFGDRLKLGAELETWAWDEVHGRVRKALLARELAMDPNAHVALSLGDYTGPLSQLHAYQVSGIDFLVTAGSAVLADDMGLGKTAQMIATVERLKAYPALIICPKSVKESWRREYELWAPNRETRVATRPNDYEADSEVLIVHWDALRTKSRLAPYGSIRLSEKDRETGPLNRAWGAVVADEAHRAIHPDTKQTRALWAIGASATHRFAMTGTPIANEPQDLWALLHFVAPDEWPSRSAFLDRYCLLSPSVWGGVEVLGLNPVTKQEFYAASNPRFLRRSKKLVLPQLPEKVYEVRETPMKPKQSKAYRQITEDQVAWLDSSDNEYIAAFNPLSVLTRQLQFASAYATVNDDGDVTLAEPSNKVDGLLDLLEDMGDEQLVVFALSRQLIDLAETRLVAKGIACCRITGAESEAKRARSERLFRDGDARVILLTLGAGSVGLTLTSASTMAFLQRSYSLVDNKQAEDRIHRLGQEASSVTIVDFVTPGTVEESSIGPAMAEKQTKLEEITRDGLSLRAFLTGSL